MSYVTITEDPTVMLASFSEETAERVDQAMRINAYYLADVMRWLTPVRTGETAESIGVDEAWMEYDVGSDSPVFGWLDKGTMGHGPIVPITASALHWLDEGGGDVFAKYVLWVSGIEPMEITDTAVDLAEPAMDANIELALDSAWEAAH